MKKKILIVGGAGYIGTVITNYFLNQGHKVVSIDNFLYKNDYSIHSFLGNPNYRFYYGDLCNQNFVENILKDVSDIVLLAGLVGDPITKKYPDVAYKINDIGIKNFIKNCNGKGINRLIFVSTCSNYGLINENELADENYELKPLSLYSKSKVKIEKYILGLKNQVDYHPTILRFATAFGLSPRMRFDLTVSEFVRELANGKELLVYDAHTWRPYCHVLDFARLIEIVLDVDPKKVSFETFNAGGDVNNFTKKGIVDLILLKINDAKIKYQEHGSDPRNYKVNFSKVKKVLDFIPKYSVEYGVVELLVSINNHAFDNLNNLDFGNYKINYNL
jgi:nucleoside-diphosphate-sugar epimerase